MKLNDRIHCPVCGSLTTITPYESGDDGDSFVCPKCATEWTLWRNGIPLLPDDESDIEIDTDYSYFDKEDNWI